MLILTAVLFRSLNQNPRFAPYLIWLQLRRNQVASPGSVPPEVAPPESVPPMSKKINLGEIDSPAAKTPKTSGGDHDTEPILSPPPKLPKPDTPAKTQKQSDGDHDNEQILSLPPPKLPKTDIPMDPSISDAERAINTDFWKRCAKAHVAEFI